MIENEADVGFNTHIIHPDHTTELCRIYKELNSSDAMVGMHGAA